MKKYIGTKQVEAEPMTLGEFIKQSGRNPYANSGDMHTDDEPGYIVKYQDGYVSWSPKETFEEAYKIADTFLDKLHIEAQELAERFEKCAGFVDNNKFRSVIKDDYPAFFALATTRHYGMVSTNPFLPDKHSWKYCARCFN